MSRRITPTFIQNLRPPKANQKLYFDARVPGLALRVRPNGLKSWILQYYSPTRHKQYRFTFIDTAHFDEWEITEEAEHSVLKEAKRHRSILESGKDPEEEDQKLRAIQSEPAPAVELPKQAGTVKQMCDDYQAWTKTRKRDSSKRNDKSMIENIIVPAIGAKLITEVKPRDVQNILTEMVVEVGKHPDTQEPIYRGQYRANRTLALLKSMFNWYFKTEDLDLLNPCRHIDRYEEHSREVYLNAQQVERLEKALDESESPDAADAIRLLMLTGSREKEVLHAMWEGFDLERGIWMKMSHANKGRRKEVNPLLPEAVAVLRALKKRKRSSVFLFPNRDVAGKPRASIRRTWITALKRAGLAEKVNGEWVPIKIEGKRLRLHDLRHTFVSHLVSGGVSLPMAGSLIGQRRAETTNRYTHLMLDAKRDALKPMGKVWNQKTTGSVH